MQKPNAGNIRVITGPMFSGKTSSLIPIIEKYEEAGKRIKLFRPTQDDRYDTQENTDLKTNNNRTIIINTQKINSSEDLLQQIFNLDALFVDEGQFFDKNFIKISNQIRMSGKEIIITGLDMDVYKNPFGIMPQLLAIADHVTKLVGICDFCKEEKANFSYFKNTQEEFERLMKDNAVIGGKEYFGCICTECENKHHKTFN